jgi:hypothetical protein
MSLNLSSYFDDVKIIDSDLKEFYDTLNLIKEKIKGKLTKP